MNDGDFVEKVRAQAALKLKARHEPRMSVWFGLGMSGLIGWAVIIPTLIGAAVGLWVDEHYPSRFSWTLMLLALGVALGCFNAWSWVASENQKMHRGPNG